VDNNQTLIEVPSLTPPASNSSNMPDGDVTFNYQDKASHALVPDEVIKGFRHQLFFCPSIIDNLRINRSNFSFQLILHS
jgi:hypothetical protein